MTFISKVKQGAINGWHTHQILPSISIAQAILESASGTSTLGAKYNNLFGIKASEDWTGKIINLPTREHGANGSYQTYANFRWYDSWNDSMLDHAAFFTNTPWREENYKDVVGEKDYKKAAQALQSAGYATDPQYATKLIQRIEQNNLTQYDTEAFNGQPSNVGVIKKVVGGTLTELAKSAIKQYNVTLIGDSLGVGTQPKLTGVFKSFTHDVLGSRQITHATNSLNGTYVLQSLKDYGQLKDVVVVILGTNRGVTDTEIDNFVAIAGSNRKVIFVDTNSNVAHRQSVSDAYRRASERHNNVYFANWMAHSNSLRSRYYGGDDIHMTNEGYQAHADFIKMAVYEAGVGVKTTSGTIGTLTEYIGIEGIDYKDGDLVSPKGESVIYNHPANELWGSKTGDKVIWIESILEVDSDDPQFILETAVKVMKENGQPAAQYVVDLAELPDDVSIGDWGYVLDHEFNPPLYIHARVLEIITSETDLNANKAVIGNVTEVFPADKSDIKLIQSDLKDVRDNLVREYRNGQPILMLVNSTNGSTLGDKYTETELVAKVTQGSEDLTNRFITYKWERVSNDTISDDAYNAIIETETTNRLIITSKDIVNNLSTFVVRVYDGNNLINQSSITIKHVDTALWTDTNTPPSDAKDGATWVDESGKQWVKKDGEWEERVDQAVISQVRVEVEGAMAEAEQAKADAIKAYEDAVAEAKAAADAQDKLIKDQIATEVGTIGEEMAQAKQEATNKANQALADAKAHAIAQDTALKTILQGEIGEAMAEAEQAKQGAIKAYEDSIAEAERLVSEQNTVWQGKMDDYDEQVALIDASAKDAQTKADQALQEVGVSTNLAQTAKDLAQTAQSNASTAISNASQAISDASGAVSQALNAFNLATSAKSDVSSISLDVDDLAGQVSLKANQTVVDQLSGTVNNHTADISANAQAIQARLTSTQVSDLVDEKGLAKVTYVDNQITTTANSINGNLSRVEGKIPLSYQEENLVFKGDEYYFNTSYKIARYDLSKELVVGKTYTIVLKGGIGTDGVTQKFSLYTDNSGNLVGDLQHLPGGIYRLTFTLVQTGANSGDKKHITLYNRPSNTTAARIDWLKLVEGAVTDNNFTPSRADLITQYGFGVFETDFNIKAEGWDVTSSYVDSNKTKINSLISNSDGWQNTISYVDDNKAKINQTIARVDSYQQTIGANGEKIAQMVMTDSLFSTKVLASVEIGGRNYAVGTTDKMQYNQQILEWSGNMQANTSKNVYTLADLGAKVGDTYTASIYIGQSGGFGSGLRIDTQSVASKYVTPKTMHDFATVTFTVEEGDTEFRFFYANTSGFNALYRIEACKFQIEKGNKRTDWNPSPLDKADQSQVTQLEGSWALTLKSGGDIKSQINATTDGIRLQSKLIHLSGTSLIDDATIKSAMIDTLNVSKLTGTEAEFTSLRSKVITAKSINANHIKADALFVDLIYTDQALVDRIWAKQMWTEKITTMKLSAGQIKSGTIDTARLDASDIVTEGLTANVIESTHIKSDTLLVDKIFANQVLVDHLWSKAIWTTKLTAMKIDASQINAGTIDTARLNASDIVTKGLTADVVTSTHIKADDALIDELFATSALIERLTSKTAFINQLKAIDLVADKASFVTAGFKALNSQATINGNAIRIQNTAGEFVEMNNTPELRSDDAGGTAVVLGKGRVHFYDSRGHSKGYVGTDMHTAGSYDFGTFLSKGTGIYRFARMADATETTYAYYTVKAGITTPSPIITDMVQRGLLPDGNAQQFVAKGNMISQLNGWPSYPNWPALSVGQQIRYKELTAQTTGDAYEDIWKFGPSSNGDWRIYFAKHATFEGGTTGTSDRRIKHDIAPTQIEALRHIDSLTFKEFKWNRNNSFEPLGLIAQDSGILRVPGGEDEMEGIDIQRALMLALKGIQELQEEVKQLKGA